MPMNTRDLWLVLRAQDQTNRALNAFSRNVREAGDRVSSAHLQAQKAAAQSAIVNSRLENELRRVDIQYLAMARSAAQYTLRTMNLKTHTVAQIDAQKALVQSLNQQILVQRHAIATTNAQIAAERQSISNIDQQIAAVKTHNAQLEQQEKQLRTNALRMRSMGEAATTMGFGLTIAAGAGVLAMNELVQTAVEYDKQVRATATQVDGFGASLQDLADIGRRTARDIAVPFAEIQPALFDIFSSMEVGLEDAERLLRAFSKAAVAGGVEIQSVSRATIGILNAFQRPASDVNKILDMQFQLIQEGLGTYDEWTQRIGLVTPSAVRAGQSIEMMMGALAAATRMGTSAARAGTAVARAFDALSHPKTVTNLKALGVNVQDATGKFRPFNEVLRDFRAALMKMPEKDRLATIVNVFKGAGGTIEARRFLQQILLGAGGLEMFDNVLGELENSAGSMEKAYGIMADSASAKTQILKNNWWILKEAMGQALLPAFIMLTEKLTVLVDAFNQLSPTTKRNIAYALAFATAFAAIVGPLLLLVGVIAAFAAAVSVAGTAILATMAALVGIIAVLGTAATIFSVLYVKSESFRESIKSIGLFIVGLKDILVDFLRDVQGSWDKHLAEPIGRVANIIETKLLPATNSLQEKFGGELLDKIGEAGRIIGDIVGKAFEFIGNTINTLVVPALEWLSTWWGNNKSTIEPLLPILAQVVKWFLIIAAVVVGVLVVALVGPLVAGITAVITVAGLLVAAFIYAWQYIQFMWGKLMEFGAWLGGAFVSAWNAMLEFFKGVWQSMVDIWNAFSSWFASTWSNYWNSSIGKLLIAVWDLIVATVRLGIAVIQFVIAWGLEAIKTVWDFVWGNISEGVKFVWNVIVGLVNAAIGMLVGGIKNGLNIVQNVLTAAWNIALFVTRSTWNGMVDAVRGAWNAIWGVLSGIGSAVQGALAGAGRWLYNAGRSIIQGLIDGITDMIGSVTRAIDRVTGIIRDHMPGSPVKRGPLRVLNRGYAGGQIVKMVADGILGHRDAVTNAMSALGVGAITGIGQASSFISPENAFSRVNDSEAAEKYITNNFNISTQEIDPRKHAADLGWELAKVM